MCEGHKIKKLYIIPALNEEETVGRVIEDLLTVAAPDEILVVNDGSSDDTLAVIQSYPVHCIDFPYNLGVSSVIQAGFKFALRHGHDLAIQFDGDGQHLAAESQKIIDLVRNNGCDIAIGSRQKEVDESSSLPRRLGGAFLSRFLLIFTGQQINDPTSGFRAYSKRAIEVFAKELPDEYPEVESIVLAKKRGLSVEEVTVSMAPRRAGKSSISFIGSWYYMVKTILALFVMMLRKY